MKIVFLLFAVAFLFSCNNAPKEVKEEKKEKAALGNNVVDKIIGAYLGLKEAFILLDTLKINQATNFLITTAKVDTANIGDIVVKDKLQLETDANQIITIAEAIAAKKTIPEKLNIFKDLTEFVKPIGALSKTQTLYVQNCPMAAEYSKDENVYWVSSEEKIRNPFFPKTMPGCGVLVDTLVMNK